MSNQLSNQLTKHQKETLLWLENYIHERGQAPTLREIQAEMQLSSVSQVQSRLNALRRKNYVDWDVKRARTLRVLKPSQERAMSQQKEPIQSRGVPLWGVIAASGWQQVFPDQPEEILPGIRDALNLPDDCFALRVKGDSMINALIADGDIVFLHPPIDRNRIRNRTIVAARVGHETTLKHYYRRGNIIELKPANPNYTTMTVDLKRDGLNRSDFDVQGVYCGVVRRSGL